MLHPDGTMQITDRAKDVIKSGGEWISSVDLENAAVGCPGVAEAAAIGIASSQMGRAAACCWSSASPAARSRADGDPSRISRGHVAKWWLPDEIVFVDELPHTATGKLLKTALRERFKGHELASISAKA